MPETQLRKKNTKLKLWPFSQQTNMIMKDGDIKHLFQHLPSWFSTLMVFLCGERCIYLVSFRRKWFSAQTANKKDKE